MVESNKIAVSMAVHDGWLWFFGEDGAVVGNQAFDMPEFRALLRRGITIVPPRSITWS